MHKSLEERWKTTSTFFLVLSKFLDVEHLISLCIQISKREDIKAAETRITEIIYLKHTLELVQPLKEAINDGQNPLLIMYAKVWCFLFYISHFHPSLSSGLRAQKYFST